jgi:ABC-type uncharacterized transport system involved in gliding motility auxiliary subunit
VADDPGEVAELLREIRDAQRAQLAKQDEALRVQREQLLLVQRQAERAERINDRAEQLQVRSAEMIGVARKTLFAILPILVVLIAYVTWLIFR